MPRRSASFILCLLLVTCQFDPSDNEAVRVPNPTPKSTRTRIVGLVGTMSGLDSWRGDDAFEGADLAVHVLNRSLSKGERAYELVTLDDRGSAGQATLHVEQLARSDRTVGIVYAGPPEGLPPAEKELAHAGIPAILCYGDLYSARLLSAHVFQASPAFLWEARRIVDYLLHDRGYRRIGMLATDDPTGTTARRALALALHEEGGSLVVAEQFGPHGGPGQRRMNEWAQKGIEALVVEASPEFYEGIQGHLVEHGFNYRSTAHARSKARRGPYWAPQVVGFDTTGTSESKSVRFPRGTIAADSYARGAHYLPIPNFRGFAEDFEQWWGEEPLGWEQRAYDAVSMIGWAVRRTARSNRRPSTDLAAVLERMDRVRFAGLDITLGPDDHTAVGQSTVGLWVVPKRGAAPESSELPNRLPWVPLARGFSIDGERTDMLPEDWKWLFRNAPPKKAPAPRISRSRFGVTTSSQDPVH